MDGQASFLTKRNIINLLFLSIMVLALPIGTQLVQDQKILKSFAAQESIRFITDGKNVIDRQGKQVAISPTITLEVTSKDGLPSSQASANNVQLSQLNYTPINLAYAREAFQGECGINPDDEVCYCDGSPSPFCACTDVGCGGSTYPAPYGTPVYPSPVQEQPKEEAKQAEPKKEEQKQDEFQSQGSETSSDECIPGRDLVPTDSVCRSYGENAEECTAFRDSCGNWPVYKEEECKSATPGNCDKPVVEASMDQTQIPKPIGLRGSTTSPSQTGIPSGQGGCCDDNNQCIAGNTYGKSDDPALNEKSTAGWSCTGSNPNCASGKACLPPGTSASPSPTLTAKPTTLAEEKCYVCDNNKWRLSGSTGSCPANITRTCQAGKDVNQVCKSAQDLGGVNCVSTRPYTLSLRVAENPSDLSSAPSVDYISEPMRVNYTFQDPKPGKKFIYVQFSLSDGKKVSATPVSINLSQPDAQVASLTCSLNPTGQGIKITFKGEHFGSKEGRVNVDNSIPLRILSWSDNLVVALSGDTSIRSKQDLLGVTLTRNDGEKITEKCGVGISLLSLGAKLFCRAPSQHSQDNVEVEVLENTTGAKKVKEKVKIDKEGVLSGLKSKLEEDKFYSVSIKAPKSLRRVIAFTALDGTITIPQTILPVGDIYPRDGGDGKINSLDAAELRRQWGKVSTASKNCDFNQDGVCNSFEWACMRYDFNKEDDTAL